MTAPKNCQNTGTAQDTHVGSKNRILGRGNCYFVVTSCQNTAKNEKKKQRKSYDDENSFRAAKINANRRKFTLARKLVHKIDFELKTFLLQMLEVILY